MPKPKMFYAIIASVVLLILFGAWRMTSPSAYENAEYRVIESDGAFELREYPELMLATTPMRFEAQGNDGSFMRLFGYITGENEAKAKVAMTVPVFMERDSSANSATMGFVIPKETVAEGIPAPAGKGVQIESRRSGVFAVYRFRGWLSQETALREAEAKLTGWIEQKEIQPEGEFEIAGYDPPWTPGFLRRNEFLVRIRSPRW